MSNGITKAARMVEDPSSTFCSFCFRFLHNPGPFREIMLGGSLQQPYYLCSPECFLYFSHDRGLMWEEDEVDKGIAEELGFTIVMDETELPTEDAPKKCTCEVLGDGGPLVDGKCPKCGGV